jgi:hypothetical protein
MVYVYAVVLTVLNLGFWVGILFNLSGTWLMVLVTAALKWWQSEWLIVIFGESHPSSFAVRTLRFIRQQYNHQNRSIFIHLPGTCACGFTREW